MLGEALLEQGAVGIAERADESLARVKRGAAQRVLGQWLHGAGAERQGREGSDGTTVAVCRKSSDATNVRWEPYVPDQGPDRDSSPRIFNRLRDVRRLVPGSTRRLPI